MIDKDELDRVRLLFNACGPLFIALGDEVRQKLLLDIGTSGEGGVNVTNLSAMSKLSRPAISHHLKVLKDCGLVKPVKAGTQIFYRLNLEDCFGNVVDLVTSIQKILSDVGARPEPEAAPA